MAPTFITKIVENKISDNVFPENFFLHQILFDLEGRELAPLTVMQGQTRILVNKGKHTYRGDFHIL